MPPSTVTAQAGFPVGLTTEYEVKTTIGYYYSSYEYHQFYEVLGWAPYAEPGTLQVKTYDDFGYDPDQLIYFNISSWKYTNPFGEEYSTFVFPRLWVVLTTLVHGGTVEHNYTTGDPWEFNVTVNVPVTVPAGTFNCWLLSRNHTHGDDSEAMNLYYETSVGLLVKVSFYENDYPGTSSDDYYTWDLVNSNFGGAIPLSSPTTLILIGGAVAVIVVVVLVAVFLLRKWRTR
ncbi:MAG: hypothetical protein ACFFCO_05945 [Promethearchaeota archaeon]